ncbi:MAG: pilus assembly protein TadG-related protein [Alphaproteobacteria bacterium]
MKTLGNLLRSVSGATAITFAVSSVAVIGVTAVAIDGARYYLVHQKVQNALDAAVLAAAIDVEGVNPEREAVRVFHANYPAGYAGTEVVNVRINRLTRFGSRDDADRISDPKRPFTGEVEGSAYVRINHSMVQLLGAGDNGMIVAEARATNDLDRTDTHIEIAFVLDNSGSMGFLGGLPVQRLREATDYAIELLFDGEAENPRLHISIVPYSVAVAFPASMLQARNWAQNAWVARYDYWINQQGKGYLATRNNDNPVNSYVDVSDVAPTSEATRFRTPGRQIGGAPASIPFHPNLNNVGGWDIETSQLPTVVFGESNKAVLKAAAAAQSGQPGAYTRINVGALWGWLALSPNWRGVWSAAKPDLPREFGDRNLKFMVLMTDGTNTTFWGGGSTSNDDTTLINLCTAIKAQGIMLYTIVLETGTVNFPLMSSCATSPAHSFLSPTPEQLRDIFEDIVQDIISRAQIRLTR